MKKKNYPTEYPTQAPQNVARKQNREHQHPVQSNATSGDTYLGFIDNSRYKRCVTVKEVCRTNKNYSYINICKRSILIPPWVYFPFVITIPVAVICTVMFFWSVNPPWYHVVFDMIIFLTVLVCLFITTFRDPGIMPRHKRMPGDPTRGASVRDENGELWKFCHTCNIWRPPRSKHCAKSDACIYMYDHHCPWVGNAVGARNYLSFTMFVTGAVIWITVMVIQMACMKTADNKELSSEFEMPFMVFLITIAIMAVVAISLFVDTLRNNAQGLTTNEARLERYEHQDSHSGIWSNLLERFRNQPSQLLYNKKQRITV